VLPAHAAHLFGERTTRRRKTASRCRLPAEIPCAFVRRVSPGRTDTMTEHPVWQYALLFLTRKIHIVSETGEQCQWLR
jgi:hypothetical protein